MPDVALRNRGMKMKKYKYLALSLVVIFSAFSLAKADSPATPWSQVIPSSSGKYVLVLISPNVKEQEEYISRSREFWRKGGISVADVPAAEKALQEEIDKEAAIRRKYSESGLYTTGKIPKLLWKIDLYDMKSWIKVSDDGEHIIVGKWAIPSEIEEEPLEYNPEIRKVVRVFPKMEEIVLTFYSFGNLLRSYKASDLTSVDENLQQNTNNEFAWSEEGVLDEKTKTLSITKKSGEKLIFDMNGNLLSGKLSNQRNATLKSEEANASPQKFENSKSFCGGVILLLGFILPLLFGRQTF